MRETLACVVYDTDTSNDCPVTRVIPHLSPWLTGDDGSHVLSHPFGQAPEPRQGHHH